RRIGVAQGQKRLEARDRETILRRNLDLARRVRGADADIAVGRRGDVATCGKAAQLLRIERLDRIRRRGDLLARRQDCVSNAAARRTYGDFEVAIRSIEYARAEVERDGEDSSACRDRVLDQRGPLLRAGTDGERVEQLDLQVVIAVGRIARIGQLALVSERGGLGSGIAGNPEQHPEAGTQALSYRLQGLVHALPPLSVAAGLSEQDDVAIGKPELVVPVRKPFEEL